MKQKLFIKSMVLGMLLSSMTPLTSVATETLETETKISESVSSEISLETSLENVELETSTDVLELSEESESELDTVVESSEDAIVEPDVEVEISESNVAIESSEILTTEEPTVEVDAQQQEVQSTFVLEESKTKDTPAQGPYIADGSYVTITSNNYAIYSDFKWTKKSITSQHINKTYQAKGRYHHANGGVYYSLYDNENKWIGYVNAQATKKGNGRQGAYVSDGSYVTVTSNNYAIYSDFSWTKKSKTSQHLNKTYQARGRYHHFNGSTYYSLYNNQNKWIGYVNAQATKKGNGKQGAYISDGRLIRVNNGNYDVWDNFNWKKKTSSRSYVNQHFTARGRYQHFNGSTYYSLYDTSGNWKGYLNAKATGAPLTSNVIQSVPYVSQYTPVYAPYGCSVASMTMVLRSKGASVNLKYAMDNLPMYPAYQGGQIGSPYTGIGFQRVIQPQELTNYMRRWYPSVYNISGASSTDISKHILDGNPVLYYGYSSYQRSNTRNHVKVIAGYKNNQFLIYDPLYYNQYGKPMTGGGNPIYDRGAMHWLSVSQFNAEYGGRAIVVK